ncbi:Radical SAM superfamily protein [Neolewinella agarilytica]|uniref:Radical SAM superfamily protein n=1 Tax=Neolewinella agarilytica TaxID=478744 RepID=A0A1H8ZTG0_9BACT|nr:Radical SAM superfamily protein [Neolewinella agarilytica]
MKKQNALIPYLRPVSDILLITPPFTQLNTPYPATAYLKGFLNTKNIATEQIDLGIEVILELFSQKRMTEIFARSQVQGKELSSNAKRIFALREEYLATVEPVIAFLQGKQPTLARQIASENFLPQASRFDQLSELDYAFGTMGHQDKAKHLATLYLEDLSDFIVECVDPDFGFSRYAERIGRSANSFDELYDKLQGPMTYVDEVTIEVLKAKLTPSEGNLSPTPLLQVSPPAQRTSEGSREAKGASENAPHFKGSTSNTSNARQPTELPDYQTTLACLSVPFPGNLYSAFRCAKWLKETYPGIKTAMGGGFANTELRSVNDARVFQFFDYITLDDGELPLELLHEHCSPKTSAAPAVPRLKPLLKRTFHLEDGEVIYNDFSLRRDYRMHETGTPDYTGLPLDRYISVIEIANPMHSLWSDGRWNKLTMAHGCYWGKCTFCDVSLDYIGNYQPVQATLLVDRMEELIAQTGENGFHFVDEAAPPALMRDLALEIIRRKLRLTWWTNIRFEKSFTPDLCRLLQASGCIAVSGGLEVASDRLLELIKKGVTVEQVARVTAAFTDAGIMVHSYLMYGYPTQTVQETVDSLEMVRQLFEAGTIQSGFWHQFALTAHSPVGLEPEAYGIIPHHQPIGFANNDVQFTDSTGIDHSRFSFGLKKSLFNYMHGMCFDYPLSEWFDFAVPKTTISPDYIAAALEYEDDSLSRKSARIIWLGGEPEVTDPGADQLEIRLFDRRDTDVVTFDEGRGAWLLSMLKRIGDRDQSLMTLAELRINYEAAFSDFEDFWYTEEMTLVRGYGLLVV